MNTPIRPVRILLVEDNPADARLVRESLKRGTVEYELEVAEDGVEALDRIRGLGVHAGAQTPDLILLDLNLPRKDGRQVLAELKADAELGRIPVVVLSTSEADSDVARAYSLHANCYVSKPVELDDFFAKMRSVEQFWLRVARIPGGEGRDV